MCVCTTASPRCHHQNVTVARISTTCAVPSASPPGILMVNDDAGMEMDERAVFFLSRRWRWRRTLTLGWKWSVTTFSCWYCDADAVANVAADIEADACYCRRLCDAFSGCHAHFIIIIIIVITFIWRPFVPKPLGACDCVFPRHLHHHRYGRHHR